MKKFLIKILLLLLPVFILAVSMEYLLRKIPNGYAERRNYLDKYAGEIEMLILGHSHTWNGIDAEYFLQTVFNAAMGSQSLNIDFEIFCKFRKDFNKLKVIILPISYHSLFFQLESSEERWRKAKYVIHYGLKARQLTDHLEIFNNNLTVIFNTIYKNYVNKNDNNLINIDGFDNDEKIEDKVDYMRRHGKARALDHTFNIHSKEVNNAFAENVEILNLFAEICSQDDILLIFITTPVYHTYRENINYEQFNKMIDAINSFEKYDNVHYIDYFADSDFTIEDYLNSDHLNKIGAYKLSTKLANYIDCLDVFKQQ